MNRPATSAGTDTARAWIVRHVRPYRPQIVQILILTLLTVGINFVIPLTSKEIIDHGVLLHDFEFIALMAVIQAGLYIGMIAIHTIKVNTSIRISAQMTTTLVWSFFSHLLHLPMSFFARTQTGGIIERIGDFRKVQSFISDDVIKASGAAVYMLALALLLLWIDFRLFGVFVVGGLLYFIWVYSFRRMKAAQDHQSFAAQAASRGVEVNILKGIEDIKLSQREAIALTSWERAQHRAILLRVSAETLDKWQYMGAYIVSRTSLVVITYLSARAAMTGAISLGAMTVTTITAAQIFLQVDQLLNFGQKQLETSLALSRVWEINVMPHEDEANTLGQWRPAADSAIELQDVAFAYSPGHPIINNVSLRIEKGSTVAIVGPSGSGKTTLLKLMLKLVPYDSGRIAVGDADLTRIASADWFRHCGAVMQDGVLFDDTVLGNIVGPDHVDMPWFDEVARQSCFAEVIARLPNGVDTRLGLDGIGLSMGEKQRLLIARALYKRPSYLFLDEATSALDRQNEARLSANLDIALKDVTKVVIAHRLETVQAADRIIVLDQGRVQEQGSHRDLLGTDGLYSRLVLAGR